jgi:hypothetical protein
MRPFTLLVAVAMFLAASLPASAALAPQYQRAAELRAILDDTGIVDLFGIDRPIERIEYVEPDLYRVTSGSCHVDVRIVDKPNVSGMVGPRQFEVEPGELVCD